MKAAVRLLCMSTVSDRICQEKGCMAAAAPPVVVETAEGVWVGLVLCQDHAGKVDAGTDFVIEQETGERPVIVIDRT